MTTPTAPDPPATTQPITCPIELDPMAAPCGTGLEGWGVISEPLAICLNGVTTSTTDWFEYQQAVVSGTTGACPAAVDPQPVVPVPAPAGLPVTGAEHVVMGGVAGALLAVGVVLTRLSRRFA